MELGISDDKLRIRLSLLEKILSVHGSFEIPLDQVKGATTETPRSKWRDIKLPGIYMPRVIKAGQLSDRAGKRVLARGQVEELSDHRTEG